MALSFVITSAGLTAANNAGSGGPKINLTSFQLGTGVNYSPSTNQTQLAGTSVYSGAINNYYVQDANTVVYILQVPLTAATFSWGEVGIYTDTGVLFAIAARPTLRTSELGVATTIQVNLSLTQLPANINFTVSNVQAANLSVLGSVALLQSPVTSAANTYVCKSLSEAGNAIVATAKANNEWQFLGYQSAFGPYVAAAGSTTTTVVGNGVNNFFNGSITTPPPQWSVLIQFITGALTGTVRRVAFPVVNINSVSILDTALGSVPAPGDQFRLYLSDTYAMSSGIGGVGGGGGGLTVVNSIDAMTTVGASASKAVLTTQSLDDSGQPYIFDGQVSTNTWIPRSPALTTPLCIVQGMSTDGYDSTGQTNIPLQYFSSPNDYSTSDSSSLSPDFSLNGFVTYWQPSLVLGTNVYYPALANSMVLEFKTGANAGYMRLIVGAMGATLTDGPTFSSPFPYKIQDGDAYTVTLTGSAAVRSVATNYAGLYKTVASLTQTSQGSYLPYITINTSGMGFAPTSQVNSITYGVANTQVIPGVYDTFIYNNTWAPVGWTCIQTAFGYMGTTTISIPTALFSSGGYTSFWSGKKIPAGYMFLQATGSTGQPVYSYNRAVVDTTTWNGMVTVLFPSTSSGSLVVNVYMRPPA